MLWVDAAYEQFMLNLGYKPIGYLSWLTDEDGDKVSGYQMIQQDAEAAIAIITERNALQCNDCNFIKAYITIE